MMQQKIVGMVDGYLVRIREVTDSEILAALEKAKEDSRDSGMLDEEEDDE